MDESIRQKLKPGVLAAAQLTGVALLPISGGTTSAWWFEGWDRFLVPRPFATVHIHYGPLIRVPRDADAAQIDAIVRRVEDELNELTTRADSAHAG